MISLCLCSIYKLLFDHSRFNYFFEHEIFPGMKPLPTYGVNDIIVFTEEADRKLSTEEVMRVVGEMFIQYSCQTIASISMLNHHFNLSFSGLSDQETRCGTCYAPSSCCRESMLSTRSPISFFFPDSSSSA